VLCAGAPVVCAAAAAAVVAAAVAATAHLSAFQDPWCQNTLNHARTTSFVIG
jgi:hypothetical protein